MEVNNRRLGYCRDNAILEAVDQRRALETDQVRALLFPFKAGQRKAQDRLLKLFQRNRLGREKLESGYAYFREAPGKLAHTVGVNWVRLWFEKQAKSWEQVRWEYEADYGILRCDGFAAIRNIPTGKFRFFFVEYDRGTNVFDKVQKYNYLYASAGYMGRWWVDITERFPAILVVTEAGEKRIHEMIRMENEHGLEFIVKNVTDIRKEVITCKS